MFRPRCLLKRSANNNRRLKKRVSAVDSTPQMVLTLQGAPAAQELACKLVYVQTIGALETFLWETAYYWIERDKKKMRSCITQLPVFAEQKILLRDIFDSYDGLKNRVKSYLHHLVWHRWDEVAPLYLKGLGVKLPSTRPFKDALEKRHDIVHRSGNDRDGNPVTVSVEEIAELGVKIQAFCEEVSASFNDF
jgi:hypothetical protein